MKKYKNDKGLCLSDAFARIVSDMTTESVSAVVCL